MYLRRGERLNLLEQLEQLEQLDLFWQVDESSHYYDFLQFYKRVYQDL